jgi:hypothetical protein
MTTADIRKRFDDVTTASGPADAWVQPYGTIDSASDHQFVLFLKPEATAVKEGVDLDAILALAFEELNRFDVHIGAVRILNGDYLKDHQIMDRHYGVINAISKQGVNAISTGAKEKLQELYGDLIQAGAQVLGAHQFLDAYPDFNALSLCCINDTVGTQKLAGGTYCLRLDVLGAPVIILNPFHPYQLVPYTTPGNGIIVMEGRSATPWKDLREKLTGATDPTKAPAGSIRQRLLANASALGLKSVTQGTNGIHLSAGPLEGMVELQRFFDVDHTCFGKLLADKGLSAKRITELANNIDLEVDGGCISAFDLTEELDSADAAAKLTA